MTILSIEDFHPVTLDDFEFFRRFYQKYPPTHSDNSFTNMVCWMDYAHYKYARTGKNLLITSTIDGDTSIRGPMGPRDPEILKEIIRLGRREGGEKSLLVFDISMKEWVQRHYPSLNLYPDRDFYDYVYPVRDLARLPGKRYLTIRKHLNKFRRNCDYSIECVSRDNIDEVTEFLEKWCRWKHCEEKPVLAHEKDAALFAVAHFFDLHLTGLIIRVEDTLSALAVFERLNADTCVVHFEKALPGCEGIYKQINQETAKFLYDRVRFINRESDLGITGLREAKMRYHPHHFVKVYYAKRDEL